MEELTTTNNPFTNLTDDIMDDPETKKEIFLNLLEKMEAKAIRDGLEPEKKAEAVPIIEGDVLKEFWEEIQTDRFKPIPTGLSNLDKALSGGFERKTLVTLAAAPGLGKTAFCQYMFENMARNGQHVIYVNLEMDRSQLLSRSISRIVYEQNGSPYKVASKTWEQTASEAIENEVTALTVRRGYTWNDKQRVKIEKALTEYRETIAPRFLYVTANPENSGSITNKLTDILGKLRSITEDLLKAGRPAPLVCIDYLQYVDFDDYEGRKPDTAESIKGTLTEFKKFAMEYSTVVLMIMANNRTSNKEGRASMDSGRDTSNIEYTGDTMLSLTYTAVEDQWKHPTGKKDKNGNTVYEVIDNDYINNCIDYSNDSYGNTPAIAKRLCIKVVKGRGFAPRKSARFIYEGKYASFTEDPDPIEHGKEYYT